MRINIEITDDDLQNPAFQTLLRMLGGVKQGEEQQPTATATTTAAKQVKNPGIPPMKMPRGLHRDEIKPFILKLLEEHSRTIDEVYDHMVAIPGEEERTLDSVKQAVYNLRRAGVLDASTTNPKRFFIRAKGDEELTFALKNAKTSVMG